MLDKPKPVRDGLSNYMYVMQQIIFKTHYLRKFRPLKIQDMCDRSIHLPVRASGFLPGTCVNPPAIGARNCCGALGERGEGGEGEEKRKRREGREERKERRERRERERRRGREEREERRERKRKRRKGREERKEEGEKRRERCQGALYRYSGIS